MSKLSYAVIVVVILLMSGCASITPTYGDPSMPHKATKIESRKFLSDLEYEEQWEELSQDGKTVLHYRIKYSTITNADKIFGAAANLFGTLFDGASKAMP